MPIRNRNVTLPKAVLIGVGLLVSTLSATLILTPAAAPALKRACSTSEKNTFCKFFRLTNSGRISASRVTTE
jgi:hypothetical protein